MVMTNDDTVAERLRLLRNLGFTKPRFRHEVAGYNFRMTGLQAAMGVVQTRKIEQIIAQKRRLAETYNRLLTGIEGLQLPVQAAWARNVFWMYGVVLQPEFGMGRDEVTEWLRRDGVDTRTFFCPMNQQPCLLSRADFRYVDCPVADRLWQNGFYLPSSVTLTDEAMAHIAKSLTAAATHRKNFAAS
jgi:perosamine synthetase